MLSRRGLLVASLLLCLLAVPGFNRADDKKADEPKVELKKATLAHIKLSGAMDETPTAPDPLLGFQPENFKLKLGRIQKAAKDPNVQALYLQLEGVGIGWGKLNEMRRAIADFKKTGKKVYAFIEAGDTMDYLLALACDEIAMPESGAIMLVGMRVEVDFYLDLFKWLGIHADMLAMGDFKAAAEPFTRNSMSPEFRKNMEWILDDHFDHLVTSIAEGRKLPPAQVKALLDDGPYTAKRAHKAGLVDKLAYAQDYQEAIQESLKKEYKVEKSAFEKDYAKQKPKDLDFSNPFKLLELLSPSKEAKLSKNPKVAVIYATGVIVTGKGGQGFFGGNEVGSTTMIEAIRKAEEEPTVKAIVLRVDSPGGSALASDLIWQELKKCKKPIVASMSDVAASGGYYISMAAKKIYAEPGTLTGSIGVVGGKIVLGGMFDKIGIKTEIIKRGNNATVFSGSTPFSDSEKKAMRLLMEDIYDQFLSKAVEGRKAAGVKMERADLEKLAGGRVYTGRQAKANGLIDELGTLEDAITEAKVSAGMKKDDEIELLILPKPRSFIDSFMESLADAQAPSMNALKAAPFLQELPEAKEHLRYVGGLLQLRNDKVWMILPQRITVK